jgi:hypothetical protein
VSLLAVRLLIENRLIENRLIADQSMAESIGRTLRPSSANIRRFAANNADA